jgi:hypothetical protein
MNAKEYTDYSFFDHQLNVGNIPERESSRLLSIPGPNALRGSLGYILIPPHVLARGLASGREYPEPPAATANHRPGISDVTTRSKCEQQHEQERPATRRGGSRVGASELERLGIGGWRGSPGNL